MLDSVSVANRSRADRCVGLQVSWSEDLLEAGSSGAAALSRRSRQPITTMSVRTPPRRPAPEEWRSVAPRRTGLCVRCVMSALSLRVMSALSLCVVCDVVR